MPDSFRVPRRAAVVLSILLLTSLVTAPSVASPSAPSAADVELAYYLPEGVDYDPDVPKPSEVLGFEVGEYHVRHGLLVDAMRAFAEASDRVTVETIGTTHERRPLIMLTITSAANHERLEAIREQHLQLSDGDTDAPDLDAMPVVVNLGYSVHGNEPSGANAALAVAYHLAAARDEWTRELLDNAVILLDPCLNPDGLARFAHWANMHRGRVPVADAQHREHREGFPNGRTNHYWFDLNRDWLLAQHPESRARLERFHAWRPNVLTDFHEMGTNSTYFFQPGVPSRKNPLTPSRNVELTQRFAEEHGRALDRIGSLYYTQETFDDFYYGKGSTYPDIHGSVGILFEQASSRGHVQESDRAPGGELTFPFSVRNQVTTSFSTLRAALIHRRELLDYQRAFYRAALEEGRRDGRRGFLFGDAADPARTHELLSILRHHEIEVRELQQAVEIGDQRFEAGQAFVVPLAQRQARLVRALFETATEFDDSIFYDVSTWTLPLAFGVPFAALGETVSAEVMGNAIDEVRLPIGSVGPDGAVAYAFEWHGYYAPRALGRLLDAGVVVHVSKDPFGAETGSASGRATHRFDRGTVVIPSGLQALQAAELRDLLATVAREDGIVVHALAGGLTPEGPDLGSPEMRPIETPRIALLVGRGISTYEAGQAWHLLDHRFHLSTTLLDVDGFGRADLDRYSHLILVDGAQNRLRERERNAIRRWLRDGGTVIGVRGAAEWAGEHLIADEDEGEGRDGSGGHDNDSGSDESTERRAYAD
ncbi:MAG: M14 metallopeptidase family protein, partial [Acidobacteriota bacterium]